MKRFITLILCLALIGASLLSFAGCDTNKDNGEKPSDESSTADTAAKSNTVADNPRGIFEAVNAVAPYDGLVSEVIYKDTDTDSMVCWTYGVVDMDVCDHITDYVITLPSNYNQTFALFIFDSDTTEEQISLLKDAVMESYVRATASTLQMYFPEQYAIMKWAVENPDKIWRQYDNALAMIIYNEGEATEAWNAFESAALN